MIPPRSRTLARSFLAILTAVLVAGTSAAAEQFSDETAVESARNGLDGYTRFPWYERDQDTIRRIDVTPPKDLAARRSKWEAKPANWSFPEWLGYLLRAFMWVLGGVAVGALIFALIRAIGSADWDSPHRRAGEEDETLRGDIDRVEALPFQLQRPQTDLLSEARRYYEAGDYRQAMIYLYSYQLVQLDRHHMIRLTRGKTNRQYLRELRDHTVVAGVLRQSMITFEDAFFGHHVITRARFEDCWQRLDEFHQQLEQVAA